MYKQVEKRRALRAGVALKRERVGGKKEKKRFCFTRSRFDLFNEVDVTLVR